MTTPRHIASYQRISRVDDRSTSLAKQAANIEAAASARFPGVPIVAYVDDGVSGARTSRKGLDSMLAAIDAGEVLAVYTDTLDRITRDRGGRVLWQLAERAEVAGIPILGASQDIDLGSASGELSASVMLAAAAFERRRTSERVQATNRYRRSQGLRGTGGSVPFGLRRRVDEPGRLEPDAATAPIVRAGIASVLDGTGIAALAAEWTAAGIPTAQGKPTWHHRTVSQLLRRPSLAGMLSHEGSLVTGPDGEPLVDQEAALVDVDTWHRLQTLLDDRKRRSERSPRPGAAPRLLLHGLAHDAEGHRLYRHAPAGRPIRYSCTLPTCHAKASAGAHLLDAFVVEEFLARFGDLPEWESVTTPGRDLDRLAALRSSIRETVAALERAKDRTERRRLFDLLEDQRDAEAAVEAASAAPVVEHRMTGRYLREAWDAAASDAERRALLSGPLERVTVRPGTRGGSPSLSARVDLNWSEQWLEEADYVLAAYRDAV